MCPPLKAQRLSGKAECRLKESEAVDEFKERVFSGCKNSAVQDLQSIKPGKNPNMVVLGG